MTRMANHAAWRWEEKDVMTRMANHAGWRWEEDGFIILLQY